jgi:hypothetical protein
MTSSAGNFIRMVMITLSAIASSNDHFPIRKRSLREAATNGRFWPITAVAIQSGSVSDWDRVGHPTG